MYPCLVELVADAIARGDFTARARCSHCHYGQEGVWPYTVSTSATATGSANSNTETRLRSADTSKTGLSNPRSRSLVYRERVLRDGNWHYTNDNPLKTPHIPGASTHTQRLANTVNTMASMLQYITGDIVKVSRAVGLEGRFDVRGEMRGLNGTWYDCMKELNDMAELHSQQVSDITNVCTAHI